MAKKEGKEGSEIVKEGDKCPHCSSTLMVALVCKGQLPPVETGGML